MPIPTRHDVRWIRAAVLTAAFIWLLPALGAATDFSKYPRLPGTVDRAEGHRRREPGHRESGVDRQDT